MTTICSWSSTGFWGSSSTMTCYWSSTDFWAFEFPERTLNDLVGQSATSALCSSEFQGAYFQESRARGRPPAVLGDEGTRQPRSATRGTSAILSPGTLSIFSLFGARSFRTRPTPKLTPRTIQGSSGASRSQREAGARKLERSNGSSVVGRSPTPLFAFRAGS